MFVLARSSIKQLDFARWLDEQSISFISTNRLTTSKLNSLEIHKRLKFANQIIIVRHLHLLVRPHRVPRLPSIPIGMKSFQSTFVRMPVIFPTASLVALRIPVPICALRPTVPTTARMILMAKNQHNKSKTLLEYTTEPQMLACLIAMSSHFHDERLAFQSHNVK
jgi:hypothetical protein